MVGGVSLVFELDLYAIGSNRLSGSIAFYLPVHFTIKFQNHEARECILAATFYG